MVSVGGCEMRHDEQCFKNQALRDLGVGGPLASCTCGFDALLRVARAARAVADAGEIMEWQPDVLVPLVCMCSLEEALKEAEHLL